MISPKTQARPYAKAIFEIAKTQDSCAHWHHVLAILRDIAQNAAVAALLPKRAIDPHDWVKWLQSLKPDLLGDKMIGNFLLILAQKRRLQLLPAIYDSFDALWRADKNEQRFVVKATKPWEKANKQDMQAFLAKQFDCNPEIEFKEDPSLLGGVEILGEGWRLDYSYRGWLEQLRTALLA